MLADGQSNVTQSSDDMIAQLDKLVSEIDVSLRKMRKKRSAFGNVTLDTTRTLDQIGAKPILKALLESIWVAGQYKFENGQYVRVDGAAADPMVVDGYTQFLYTFNQYMGHPDIVKDDLFRAFLMQLYADFADDAEYIRESPIYNLANNQGPRQKLITLLKS